MVRLGESTALTSSAQRHTGGMDYVSECPHKDRDTHVCACVFTCVCIYWPVTSSALGSIRRSGPQSIALWVRRWTHNQVMINVQEQVLGLLLLYICLTWMNLSIWIMTLCLCCVCSIYSIKHNYKHWPVACSPSSKLSPGSQTPHDPVSSALYQP